MTKLIRQYYFNIIIIIIIAVGFCTVALLWTAPELMASQRAGADGLQVVSCGTQKGDVYSFAIVMHEILYRTGLFRCFPNSEPIPPRSKSKDVT